MDTCVAPMVKYGHFNFLRLSDLTFFCVYSVLWYSSSKLDRIRALYNSKLYTNIYISKKKVYWEFEFPHSLCYLLTFFWVYSGLWHSSSKLNGLRFLNNLKLYNYILIPKKVWYDFHSSLTRLSHYAFFYRHSEVIHHPFNWKSLQCVCKHIWTALCWAWRPQWSANPFSKHALCAWLLGHYVPLNKIISNAILLHIPVIFILTGSMDSIACL
jgi:hypothetical protein